MRPWRTLLALAVAGLVFAAGSHAPVSAEGAAQTGQGSGIVVKSAGAQSQFPEAIRFFAEVESTSPVVNVRVNFTATTRSVWQYNYLDLPKDAGTLVNGEYLHRLNSPERYIPPGARMRYNFEVTDEAGNTFKTDDAELVIVDARPKFKWESATSGPVTVMYSGPIETRARALAEGAARTLEVMQPVTGADTSDPITVTLYANNADMIGAIAARSATISRELITEGQAFADENVVLVLAGTRDLGTVSHEITHILVGRAAGLGSFVPTWLNEGLAEYGNLDPTVSYDRFLEWGVDTGRILPVWRLANFPADPNLTIVSYGQARSIVGHMVKKYGPEKMAQLLKLIGEGRPVEAALQSSYGFGIRQLDAEWRESVGAEPFVEATAAPTATAVQQVRPTLAPYSLTPQAEASATPAPDQVASELTPTAEPTPAPEPTATAQQSGGGCAAPLGGHGRTDASVLLGLGGLGALGLVRVRVRRRRQGQTGQDRYG
jgi:hypothetical protein